MNENYKSTKKNLPPYFSAAEKNKIYEALLRDSEWMKILGIKPYSTAITEYAVHLHGPEYLSFERNIERLDLDIQILDKEIRATLDSTTMEEKARDTVLEGFSRQRDKLLSQRKSFVLAAETAGEDITKYDKSPFSAIKKIFVGLTTPRSLVKRKNDHRFYGHPITLDEALNTTNVLADYFEALKNNHHLPKKPDSRLNYLLRCNAITRLHYETKNLTLHGIKLKNWALTDAQTVYTWLYAHQLRTDKPLISLGGIQLKFNDTNK